MNLGPSPVSWTVVPRFNRVGSSISEISRVALLGSILLLRNFPYPFTTNSASDNETDTCKQVESPGVKGNPKDVSKDDPRAVSSKFGFGFSSMRGEKEDRRAAHELRKQMKDL